MTDIHLSEDEQVEALKRWWKENGTAILVGVLIGIAGIVGVWYWQDHKHGKAESGSVVFAEFTDAIQQNQEDVIHSKYQSLQNDYHSTPYAALAALAVAKHSVDKKDLPAAETQLRWAIDNARHAAITHLARIRLTRVLIQEKKLDAALALIADQKDPAFISDYAELRGDIYQQQGNLEQARTAYAEALSDTTLQGVRRAYLEMKRDDLPTAKPVTPAEPPKEIKP
jgi:predicted negative regulator of RcsB-dependent stress response